jgi:hypothetical protein
MKTGPAERIVKMRNKFAPAVGTKPKYRIIQSVSVEIAGDGPSTVNAKHSDVIAPMIRGIAARPSGSIGGRRRMITDDIA